MGKGGGVGRQSVAAGRRASAGTAAAGSSEIRAGGKSSARVGADPDLPKAEQQRQIDKARSIIGPGATERDIASITGAPDDALVGINDWERRPGRITIGVRGGGVNMTRTIKRDAAGNLVIHNDYFSANVTGTGLGTKVFARQVENAIRLGAKEIQTLAARSSGPGGYNGYYTWARLGYDARIPPSVKGQLPKSLAGASKVSDLMRTSEGRAFWKDKGVALDMKFDLRKGSYSRTQLANYLKERGF